MKKKVEEETKVKKQKSKFRKIFEWVATSIFVVLIGACCFILISSKAKSDPTAPTKIGNVYLPTIVLSDSMEPDYKVDTALFINYRSGEDIYNKFIDNEQTTIDLTFKDDFNGIIYLDPAESEYLKSLGKTMQTKRTNQTMTHRLFYVKVNEDVKLGEGRYYFFVNGINKDSSVSSAPNQYQIFTEKSLYGEVVGSNMFIGKVFKFCTTPWGLIVLLLIPTLYMVIACIVDLVNSQEEKESQAIIANASKVAQGNSDPLAGMSEEDKAKFKKQLLEQMMSKKGS